MGEQVRPSVTSCSAQESRAGEREQEQGREATSTRSGRTENGRENISNSAAAWGRGVAPWRRRKVRLSLCEKPLAVATRSPMEGQGMFDAGLFPTFSR